MTDDHRTEAPPAYPPPAYPPPGVRPLPAALPPTTFVAAPAGPPPRLRRRRGLVVGGVLTAVVVAAGVLADPAAQPDPVDTAGSSLSSAAPSSGAPEAMPTQPPPSPAAPTTTDALLAAAPPRSALALLARLPVKGRAPKTGYDRAQFGPAWADTDRNGCDTRNDVLRRDLVGETFRPGTRDCVVVSGTLAEPYTGRTVAFSKAEAGEVQIDHVVSLSNAWQTGAFAWPAEKRLAFANDPLNLLAVDGRTNGAKSDGDAATWLPPSTAYRCPMVARQTAVKAKYALWVTAPERDAIARVLSRCPGEPAPTGSAPTTAPVAARRQAAPAAAPATAPAASAAASARDYANCDEMQRDYKGGVARPGAVDKRANGGRARYRPYVSQELYDANRESDRDDDGIACEQ